MKEMQSWCHSDALFSLCLRRIVKNSNPIDTIISLHLNKEINYVIETDDFKVIRKDKSLNELTDKEIGDIGERAFYRFLKKYYDLTPRQQGIYYKPFEMEFINQYSEKFKPYDISVCDKYFDVKTTRHMEENHFHISVKEAEFISNNFNRYYFVRVFPLHANQTYLGIQIASNFGANIYQVKYSDHSAFSNAVDELKNISKGDGFLTKTEWLENVLLKRTDSLIDYFYLLENKKKDYERDYFTYASYMYSRFSLGVELNHKVACLMKLLGGIYFKRGSSDYGVLLKNIKYKEVLFEWNNYKLEKFILSCENLPLNTIKYFAAKLLGIQTEDDLFKILLDAEYFNRGCSYEHKHLEFDKFANVLIIFDYIQKHNGEYPNMLYQLKFKDDDINEVLSFLYEYKSHTENTKEAIKTMIHNIKWYGCFDIPLRLFLAKSDSTFNRTTLPI